MTPATLIRQSFDAWYARSKPIGDLYEVFSGGYLAAEAARSATLIRAAEIIERDAERIANCYWLPGDGLWDEEGRARREYDEMLDVARKLREGAA